MNSYNLHLQLCSMRQNPFLWSTCLQDYIVNELILNSKFLSSETEKRNKYGLLTKCEVKMAGYWPSSFFACLWTETKSRSINSQKKNEANIQPS